MPRTNRPTLTAELLRPDDLLHLRIEVVNLHLGRNGDGQAVLEVEDDAEPAYLRVIFAPQSITESAFFEAALVKASDPSTPVPAESDKKRPDPDAATVSPEPLAAPGSPSQSAHDSAILHHRLPSVARIARPSRLVFAVPNGTQIPYTLEGLLAWSKLELHVNAIAAIGDEPTAAQIAGAPAIAEPSADETALELPYRLTISPNGASGWKHRLRPFTVRGRTELWHTSLVHRNGERFAELSGTAPAPLRAIWSLDYHAAGAPKPGNDPDLGRTAMNANDRHQLVVLTSAFHGYEAVPKNARSSASFRSYRATFVPAPFHAERLMLSALGGWLHSRGQWEPPRRAHPRVPIRPDYARLLQLLGSVREAAPEHGIAARARTIPDERLDLSEWVHLASQGRDHYVKIVYEGELWPFRHPAALVKVTERKFEVVGGIVGAYLMQRMYVVVRQPIVEFGVDDRSMPLKSVRLTTVVTPDIAEPKPEAGTNRTFWVEVMTSTTTSERFRFHGVATDVEGSAVDFTIPLLFVSKSDLANSAAEKAIAISYNTAEPARRRGDTYGRNVAFAPHDPAKPTDSTRLATDSLTFLMDTQRARATMIKAAVHVPQIQALLGTNQATSIRLYPSFVAHGLDAKTGVFAQIVPDSYEAFVENVTQSLPVEIAAEKAGGMATPNLAVTTLSRKLGPLAGTVDNAIKNEFDPTTFFPKGTAMLFGSFDLLELFKPTPGPHAPMSLDENAPKMRTARGTAPGGGPAIITTLDWKPKFLEPGGIFDAKIASIEKNTGGTSVLDINGTIVKSIGPGDATSAFAGSLDYFTVGILGSVYIRFAKFAFRKASGEKASVKVELDATKPIEFKNDLAFVEEIRNAIPPGLFGDGPSLELITNPLGIRAGFAFALPPLTVGVFTLKDVKLGAALTLPFLDGKPIFDFNISERPHPFLLAVGIFGGGGFFHLQLDTAGMKALEVALEFGATAALDIGVASGEVHVMAGIYFSLQRDEKTGDLAPTLTGYLRLGGSLNVLGIISISVEFNLSFTYDGKRDKAYGRATLTVSVHVLFFSKSVELTVERAFGGSGDPHFRDFFPEPEPWHTYALAFA